MIMPIMKMMKYPLAMKTALDLMISMTMWATELMKALRVKRSSLIRLWMGTITKRLMKPMAMMMTPPSLIGMSKKMMAKLRTRTSTPTLTSMKPMATWITTVNSTMLRVIPKLKPKRMITMKMKTSES